MKKKLITLLIVLIIVDCNTIYSHLKGNYSFIIKILVATVAILLFLIMIKENKEIKKHYIRTFLPYMLVMTVFYVLNNPSKSVNFIYLFLIVLPVLYFSFALDKTKTINKYIVDRYIKIMIVLSIISIFFYFLGTLLNIIKANSYVYVAWGGLKRFPSYFYSHFDTQTISIMGLKVTRNTGVFAETPMYSLNLVIALMFNLLFNKTNKNRNKYTIILIITIITTFSTTGIIVSIILLIFNYLNSNKKSKIKTTIKILLVPMILLSGIYLSYSLFTDKQETLSYKSRVADYTTGMNAWMSNPISGIGMNNYDELEKYMNSSRDGESGISNGLFTVLSQGGLLLAIIYIYPMVRIMFFSIKYKQYDYMMAIICIFLLFATTAFAYKPLAILLIVMGMILDSNYNKKEKIDEHSSSQL